MNELENLQWKAPGTSAPAGSTATKSGVPQFNGEPSDFEEWRFRVMAMYQSLADKDDAEMLRKEKAAKILEGLGGTALRVAMDLGLERCVHAEGIPIMADAV